MERLILFVGSMRDEFSEQIRRALAQRVANRCSRPDCAAVTSGPQDDPAKAVNVGVAAHIAAAAQGGPRFDPFMTPDERSSAANGIWLCQNCAKLVDNDPHRFTIEVLQRWKIEREAEARRDVGLSSQKRAEESQPLLVRSYVGKYVHEGRPDTLKFVFQVSNPNHRPVTVWGAGMEAPEVGVSAPVINPEFSWFPHELTDGQGFMFASSTDYFASELHHKGIDRPVDTIGYVTDALGRTHRSKPVKFPDDYFAD